MERSYGNQLKITILNMNRCNSTRSLLAYNSEIGKSRKDISLKDGKYAGKPTTRRGLEIEEIGMNGDDYSDDEEGESDDESESEDIEGLNEEELKEKYEKKWDAIFGELEGSEGEEDEGEEGEEEEEGDEENGNTQKVSQFPTNESALR